MRSAAWLRKNGVFGKAALLLVVALELLASGCGGHSDSGGMLTPTPIVPTSNPSCPSVTLEFAVGPTTGVAPFPELAQEPPPNPGTTSAGSVCFSAPADSASVTSPVHVVAPAKLVNPVKYLRLFVDGHAEFFTFFNTVDAQMMLSTGPHKLEVL